MKANYEEDKVIVSATEPTGVNRKKVWFKKGKNLFNKTNYIIDSGGKIGFVLDLEKGETYTISSNLPLYVAKFANFSVTAGNYVGPEHWGKFIQWTFIAGDNIANVLNNTLFLGTIVNTISTNISDFDNYNIQIEKGSAATAYEAHVEPEIYILNNNNVYEKFEKNENKETILFEGSVKFGNNVCVIPDNIRYVEVYFKIGINKNSIRIDTGYTPTSAECIGTFIACTGTNFAEVEMNFLVNRYLKADYIATYANLNSDAVNKNNTDGFEVYKVVGYK